jgi:hypothetical protein
VPSLRRGPVSLSRAEPSARSSEELHSPCSCEMGCPRLRRAPSSLSRWRVAPSAPRGAGCRPPVRRSARCSEERRLPYLGGTHPPSEEVGRCPGWNRARGAPKSAVCPMPGTERTMLINKRRLPCPGWPGVPTLSGGGDGCARKRCRCDDAPIRRSGPPRHRAHSAVGGRSSRRCSVKLPCECRCRSADAAGGNRTPRGVGVTPTGCAGGGPVDRPKAITRCPRPRSRDLRCTAPAPTEMGRRLGPSKPHEAADFKALLR